MNEFYADDRASLYLGDVREVLRSLPAESVQTCVTSPPYWSLRDYGIEPSVWGGRPDCEHEWADGPSGEGFTGTVRWQHTTNGRGEDQPEEKRLRTTTTRETRPEAWGDVRQGQFCGCGAWRGALGLEPTPSMFVAHMVEVFREVRRVLRPDGTAWVNLGDSYAGSWGSQGRQGATGEMADRAVVNSRISKRQISEHPRFGSHTGSTPDGLKPKDLVGIPWRVAFALQEDGWWLRQDIIWSKPNPMPESVRDRCTKAHEYVFLLSKGERYYWDQDAIREITGAEVSADRYEQMLADASENWYSRIDGHPGDGAMKFGKHEPRISNPKGRNKRSVWTVPTSPFPEAHFATFPPALIAPMILAGAPIDGVVLDPFVGSGTTAIEAKRLGRRAIGIDLNPDYLGMAVRGLQLNRRPDRPAAQISKGATPLPWGD